MKVGYCGLVGKPNVGKSTLLNALLKYKLAIISPKPQTTRHRILGILSGEGYQILFLDSPGILTPKYTLQEMMVKEIMEVITDSDVILFVTEAFGPPDEIEEKNLKRLLAEKKPTLIVINKVDLVPKDSLLPIIDKYQEMGFKDIYPISALQLDGIEDLKKGIVEKLPEGEPYYPPEEISDRPQRFFVAEILREAIFNLYGEEIPYATTVEVEEFKEREGGKDYIRAIIYVEKPSQKKIIIGEGGKAIKRLGSWARKNIENFLGKEVYLELWVKVAEGWRKDINFIRDKIYNP
ncbi:MAG: GTPase Era [candidate division WOR-3 bacterium]